MYILKIIGTAPFISIANEFDPWNREFLQSRGPGT